MVIDVDRRAILRSSRRFTLIMAGVCTAAFVLVQPNWFVDVVLAVNAVIWLMLALSKSSELHELDLIDDEHLHERRM